MKHFYTISEFARLVDREEFTIREWCQRGRIRATVHFLGRGSRREWRISHEELLRYRDPGLLPPKTRHERRGYYTLAGVARRIGHYVKAISTWCRGALH